MNIFKILSSADGRINEPNISAFLAYLLNPNEDHSLGCEFLLEVVAKEEGFDLIGDDSSSFRSKIESGYYYVEIITEHTVFPEKGTKHHRDIDVLIQIFEKDSDQIKYAICIENKILTQSASDKNQLKEEMIGLEKYYKDINPDVKLGLIYIVPEINAKIKEYFETVEKYPNKKMLLWKSADVNAPSIKSSLVKILTNESIGSMDPIYDSMKHLIKSFIAFINYDFKCISETRRNQTERNSYGKPMREYLMDIWMEMTFEETYPVDVIRQKLRAIVENASGKMLNKSTEICQIYRATVNNPNRVNYSVCSPNDTGNLFYKSGNDLKKFDLAQADDDIEIYYKEKGDIKTITVKDLKSLGA